MTNICHVYSGTVAGVAKGVQYTVILPDGSRLSAGQDTLEGNVAGHDGTADFMFSSSRACFPACPSELHIWALRGTSDLTGLQLDLKPTGSTLLTYAGTYSIDEHEQEGDTQN